MSISSRPAGTVGFKPLKIRWVVERTFAWLGRYRRHSRDYEKRTDSSASMLLLRSVSIRLNKRAPVAQPAFHYRPEVEAEAERRVARATAVAQGQRVLARAGTEE